VLVEKVDKGNQPVPPGVFGDQHLVTPLYKRSQALIRYVIEDRVRFSGEPRPCGRPFKPIDAIEGRMQEVLSFRRAGGGEVRIHPLLFHTLMDLLPVSGWQWRRRPSDCISSWPTCTARSMTAKSRVGCIMR